jgi:hypothetical protein
LALGLLFSAAPSWGQPYPRFKTGEEVAPAVPPRIYRATAAEVKGDVVVQLTGRSARITDKKDVQGVTLTVHVWENMKPLTLGKEIKAYSQAGKPLSKEAVLKALAKQVSVVCFVRLQPGDPEQPDPLYTAMFRYDTVVLVFHGNDLLR